MFVANPEKAIILEKLIFSNKIRENLEFQFILNLEKNVALIIIIIIIVLNAHNFFYFIQLRVVYYNILNIILKIQRQSFSNFTTL